MKGDTTVEITVQVIETDDQGECKVIGENSHSVTMPADLRNITFPAHSKVNFLAANEEVIKGFAANCAGTAIWEASQRYHKEIEGEQARLAQEELQGQGPALARPRKN